MNIKNEEYYDAMCAESGNSYLSYPGMVNGMKSPMKYMALNLQGKLLAQVSRGYYKYSLNNQAQSLLQMMR